MSRKGCPNKIQSGIGYPRKCTDCDYISNNPPMYHYHKKTHEVIPEGTLCDHGCNQPAQYRGTGSIYTCLPMAQHCPEYIRLQSERITKQWEGQNERRETTKQSMIARLHNPTTIAKMKETKRLKFGLLTPEIAKQYRSYARAIRQRAQKWAKEQGYVLGKQTYHVDHKFSILDSWHAELKAEIVNHPANLEIIEAKKNSSKGSKSSITLEELMSLISNS